MHGKLMVLDALNSIAIFLLLITVGTGSLFGTAEDVTNWSYACINPHDLSPVCISKNDPKMCKDEA